MKSHRWILLGLLALTAGCVASEMRPILTYSPVATADNKNNIVVKVQTFNDTRQYKDTGGPSANPSGIKCDKVIPQNSVAQWVTDALKAQLDASGYNVVYDQSDSPNIITGEVYEVCGKTYEASIGIKVVLQHDGKTLLNKDYDVKRDGEVTFSDGTDAYTNTMAVTLKAALLELVSDLQAALKP